MSIATRPFTAEDILETPEGDGKRYELIAGELIVTASPSVRHAWIVSRIVRALDAFVGERDLGTIFGSPVDVRLTLFDVVVPDILYVRKERQILFGEHFLEGAPDLVVEVLSSSTRSRDLTEKMALYARMGIAEYWIADPEISRISIYGLTATGGYELLASEENRVVSRVLPGIELDPRLVFSLPE
jgi:Uma2 family endonuclease